MNISTISINFSNTRDQQFTAFIYSNMLFLSHSWVCVFTKGKKPTFSPPPPAPHISKHDLLNKTSQVHNWTVDRQDVGGKARDHSLEGGIITLKWPQCNGRATLALSVAQKRQECRTRVTEDQTYQPSAEISSQRMTGSVPFCFGLGLKIRHNLFRV